MVDLPYAELVSKRINALEPALRAAGIPVMRVNASHIEEDERLGLALMRVRYAAGSKPGNGTLTKLMKAVRDDFRTSYGWTPTMGKNRVLAHTGAGNHAADAAKPASYIQGGGLTPTSYIQGGIAVTSYIQGGGGGFPRDVHDPLPAIGGPSSGRGVRVAVLDTALFPNPRLSGSYLADRDSLLDPSAGPFFYLSGHGTFVTGLIQRRAPAASIELHRVLAPTNAGAKAWDVARKMAEFVGSGNDIVNLSLGCFTGDNQPPLLLKRAVELLTPSVVVVAAAGNYHGLKDRKGDPLKARPFWPAALDEVIAVGADDKPGSVAQFSPRDPWVTAFAPGVDVRSTYLQGDVSFPKAANATVHGWPQPIETFGGVASWSGSSFSAAAMSGAIAALTIPGRRSARDAMHELLTGKPHGDVRRA